MSAVTTHILDVSVGLPAAGVPVGLYFLSGAEWKPLASSVTDTDGRARDLLASDAILERGTYRLRFDVAAYFRTRSIDSFYPEVTVTFEVRDPGQHYHVPLLLSPYGYTTYRGS